MSEQLYSASRSSAIIARAAVSSKGKKSKGPGLLLLDVTADATSRPATPRAADIALKILALSLDERAQRAHEWPLVAALPGKFACGLAGAKSSKNGSGQTSD
jgi:hypothetical protein